MTARPVLPQWASSTLSDVTTIIRGVTYKKAQASNQPFAGSTAILRANNIQGGNIIANDLVYVPSDLVKPHQRLLNGDIVVAMSSGSKAVVGKTARIKGNFDGSFGAFCGVLRPVSEIIPTYLAWFTHSLEYRNRISSLSAGANINNLKPKHFDEIQIPLAPLAEQKAIAEKLDTLLAQAENTKVRIERVPQILKRFRQSVLAAAVGGRLTEEWRESRGTNLTLEEFLKQLETLRQIAVQEENQRTGKKSKYKTVNIDTSDAPAKLPESWKWIPVEALATKVTDGVHKKPTYVSSGVPFITVKNLTKGNGISFSETNFISENDHEEFCKRTNPEKGDILISKDGTLGVVRQIRTDKIFSIFVSVALVKPADRRMSDYLEIAFQSPVVQGQMIGVGTGLQHIHLTDLRKDLIPVPPLDEQTEIVCRVNQLFAHADRIEQQVNSALARVNNVTQSILAKAFRGELTEQWRKDNPELISGENSAQALLKRVKSNRTQNGRRKEKRASA